ncbi:MAG: hypothetical protein KJO60_01670 [Desulfofustis sp.]|nr:hypothetical protein [Desulfofustis sp.]MBT8346928.1 hypothetical protein [Desulfofustis sp.]MBT8353197.1 hypothetical protein [Desulfofustis sp.]NNF46476.1 hypothetical protein [Desulfofustis sp.]NNK57828.1 hypothetical protein [Desulfofustis sp.]
MRLPFRQSTELAIIFVTAFIVVAFVYAFLAAFTSFFYRKMPEAECSYVEKLIRSGKATFGQRVTLFWHSVFGSLVVSQCYIAAAFLTGIYWFVWM